MRIALGGTWAKARRKSCSTVEGSAGMTGLSGYGRKAEGQVASTEITVRQFTHFE